VRLDRVAREELVDRRLREAVRRASADEVDAGTQAPGLERYSWCAVTSPASN